MKVFDCLDDETKKESCLAFGQSPFPAHILVQVLTVNILTDNVDGALCDDSFDLLHELRGF